MVRQLRPGVLMTRRLAAVAAVTLALECIVRAETIDRVVSVVGGHVIMLSDVSAARELGLESPDPGPDPVRAMLSRLIDRQLMLAEVDRYAPPEPAAEAVDRGLAAVRGVRSPARPHVERWRAPRMLDPRRNLRESGQRIASREDRALERVSERAQVPLHR